MSRNGCFLAAMLSSVLGAQTGSVSGTVRSTDGAPVAGARVSLSRMLVYLPNAGRGSMYAPGEATFSVSVSSDSSGNLSAAGLPPGNYLACVEVPERPFLDPCKWSRSIGIDLRNTASAVLPVSLKLGVFLRVRINDPQHVLPSAERSPLDFPRLIVGVKFGNGAFLAAQRVSADAGGQDYRMPIPAGMPLKLWLHSRFVRLSDEQGRVLPNLGAEVPFQAAEGTDRTFSVNVTGAASEEE